MAKVPRALTETEKETFRNATQPLPSHQSDRRLVQNLFAEICRKHQAGWSYAEIREELAHQFGFQGTQRTLYNYVSQQRIAMKKRAAPPEGSATNALASAPADAESAAGPSVTIREAYCGMKGNDDPGPPTRKPKKPSLAELLNRRI